jgi:hypothetical protein
MNKNLLRIASTALLIAAQPSFADIYGVVIGIDKYSQYISLDGAVNDAKMVADSLKAIGAKQVKLLLDDQATRDEVKKAWDELSKQAKPGDTLFFTFAGHGAQHPERIKGSESDGQDEFYVLGNFTESDKNTYERVIDDDLQEWFSKRPDLNVILVSDSCHSGTMTRSYKHSKLKYRKASVKAITNDALPVSNNPDIVNEQKTVLPNVFSFSGVPDNEEVPEITIDEHPHGALSWFFSKGITGEADADKDGSISIVELKNYVVEKVRMQTEGIQHPLVSFAKEIAIDKAGAAEHSAAVKFSVSNNLNASEFVDAVVSNLKHIQVLTNDKGELDWDVDGGVIKNDKGNIVFSFPDINSTRAYRRKDQAKENKEDKTQEAVAAIQQIIDGLIDQPKIGVNAELGAIPFSLTSENDVAMLANEFSGIKLVNADSSLLEWNVDSGLIRNQFGDTVVHLGNVAEQTGADSGSARNEKPAVQETISKVQAVIDKYRFVDFLKASSDGTLEVKLLPNDKLHEKGESVRFEINRFKYPFLTLVNFAVDGSINFLYPVMDNDSPSIPLDKPYTLDLDVSEPFGADHLVAIATDKPVPYLHEFLKKQTSLPPSIADLKQVFDNVLLQNKYQIGIHSSFTIDPSVF